MNRQLSFQERRKAFAARRGRFVVMHKGDDSSVNSGWVGRRADARAGRRAGVNDEDNNGGGGDDLWRPQMMRGSMRVGAEVRRADSRVV